MPVTQTHLTPPDGFTGEAVIAADIRSVSKFPRKDTRVEGATTTYQVQFNLKETANPIYWTAPNEEDCDAAIEAIMTAIGDQITIA